MSPRSRGGWSRQVWNASCAAPSAAFASSTVASATSTSACPVAGSSTSSVAPPVAGRHSPPMYRSALTPSMTACSFVATAMLRDYPRRSGGDRLCPQLADRHVERVVDRHDDDRRHVERERVPQMEPEVVDRLAAPRGH